MELMEMYNGAMEKAQSSKFGGWLGPLLQTHGRLDEFQTRLMSKERS